MSETVKAILVDGLASYMDDLDDLVSYMKSEGFITGARVVELEWEDGEIGRVSEDMRRLVGPWEDGEDQ